MCGIFCLFHPSGLPVDIEICRRAMSMQAHRGPDGSGEWISESRDVYIGHRRLSIIDVSDAGSQPMVGSDASVLSYNGEIYNFRSIHDELVSGGSVFRSTSDTEVLLYALERWGVACLPRLEGMFAFVRWNPLDEVALIARDPFGIKPLYYWQGDDGTLAVSSEIKSLTIIPGFSCRVDDELFPEFLRFGFVSGDRTLMRGVKQVLPGQVLRYERRTGNLRASTYWDARASLAGVDRSSRVSEEEFLSVFQGVVRRHLISDVPVGTQFSGGIDSALVSAIVVKDLDVPLPGFHCVVQDADFNETPMAEDTARSLGMTMHRATLSGDLFWSDLLERLTWHLDEPMTHPNSVGVYLVSALAKRHVKVLLSGEAADEIFGGYARYPGVLVQTWLMQVPLMSGLAEAACRVAERGGSLLAQVSRQLGWMSARSYRHAIASGTAVMSPTTLRQLTGDDHAEEKSIQRRVAMVPEADDFDVLTRCQLFDVQTYLPGLLVRQDKMSMAASIENRVPFATPGVMNVGLGLPPASRATLFCRKAFLKACLVRYFPDQTVQRRKWGFGIPLTRWMKSKAGTDRLQSLTEANSLLSDLIDTRKIHRLVSSWRERPETTGILWTLLGLQLWLNIFCRSSRVS
jgi:asparagine synthase (glutamine-hydrolysing)